MYSTRLVPRTLLLAGTLFLAACPPPIDVDPAWSTHDLSTPAASIDARMADAGAELFRRNCAACHSIGEGDVVGPDLRGVTLRREPDWLRGMIAAPDSMTRVDPIAGALLRTYTVPMVDRKLDDARVRAIIEFLRRADGVDASTPGDPPEDGSAGPRDSNADSLEGAVQPE